MSASWTWSYLDLEGGPVAPDAASPTEAAPPAGFPSQGDAESWLGEQWRALAESGVESVTLLSDGVRVYGPMSLRSA